MSTPPLRILFVCAMNKQRSVTAEMLYRSDPRLNVRSAGVRFDAVKRVDEDDLRWADVVFVMEEDHRLWIEMRFEEVPRPCIEVLDIPDDFECMDPKLQRGLRKILDPIIDALVARPEVEPDDAARANPPEKR